MKNYLLALFALLFSVSIKANVKLPRLISNGMVLQRNIVLKIWGNAGANEMVTVNFLQQTYRSKTDADGRWIINLPKQNAGGPYKMFIYGDNKITIDNILIGDVWLCAGQSNMELSMDRVKYKYASEIATANNQNIRQFLVPDKYDFNNPKTDVDAGDWVPANKNNINNFSAVAYFFAKNIYQKYKIPIGLINTAVGGSPAEAWLSEEGLKKFPSAFEELQMFKSDSLIKKIENDDALKSNNWYKKLNEEDQGYKQHFKSNTLNDNDWKEMIVPGYWADANRNATTINGVLWFRKKIYLSKILSQQNLKIELGRIVDADSVFLNEHFIGSTSYLYPPRRYKFDSSFLKLGENSIVIRVVNNSGKGGFVVDKKYEITNTTDTINLKGIWKYGIGATAKPLPSQTFIRWKPAGLYNAMIAPLHNFAIKGVLWYQGESNADRPSDYFDLMKTLITTWRAKWNQGAFPFLYVQLSNFMEATTTPQQSNWAALRQQQLNILQLKNTGMAVAIDAGEWNDIHPENKKIIGDRLALQAAHLAYDDKKIIFSGPIYTSKKIVHDSIEISFSNIGTGLIAYNNKALQQFTIAGNDNNFVEANAIIKKNKIIVWSNAVKNPIHVRYAWANNPLEANLYNKELLPASPFTTAQ